MRIATVIQLLFRKTVQQWLIAIGRKRARAILQAAEKGDSITVTEVVVVPGEGK